MKHLFKNPLFYTTFLSLLALGLIIASYVFGWTTPSQNPPAGNVVLQSVTPGGSPGYVQFASSTQFAGDANLFWDNTNKRLGIGTTTPAYGLHIIGTMGTTATTTLAIWGGNVGIGTITPGEKLEVAGNIKLSGSSPTYKITNVAAPTASADVATKGYVDAASGGGVLITYGHYCGTSAPTAGTNAPACPTGWTEIYTGFSNIYMNGCANSAGSKAGTGNSGGVRGDPYTENTNTIATNNLGVSYGPGLCVGAGSGNDFKTYIYGAITCRVCVK